MAVGCINQRLPTPLSSLVEASGVRAIVPPDLLRGPKAAISGPEISVSAKSTATQNTVRMYTFLHCVSVLGTLTGIFFGLTGLSLA